jgi:hypothetical protein
MSYLKTLLESIITEEINITKVTDAIRKRKPVKITYKADDEPRGQGERIIHPVAYGLSKAGNMVLRAFQPYGDTKTKTPHWKLFRLDKIENWDILWKRRSFDEPPGQFTTDGKYNPNGDKSMSTVYLSANFQNSRDFMLGKKGAGLMRYNQEREANKIANDPLYKFKKNIENAPKDERIARGITNFPSQKAKEYVTNDDFIEDMNKINTTNNEEQPQTSGPIEKGDVNGQSTRQTTIPIRKNITTTNSRPITKNQDKEEINTNNNIEDNFEEDERNTNEQYFE